ncbi:HotDog domain-containing protein [Zychaea mexicana]|uniref:HotDog domain-containing protein n=1 Tax=Zychaea mexicana TaxID=64656 RepID=UPI0022FE8C6D|nr:HotDog domain-containing protein [Zychaea mexicana]KAI9499649.1 HotDog domain-containing protein [Zychaea mexicana]
MQPFIKAFDLIRNLWLRVILFIAAPVFPYLLPDPYTQAGNVRDESKPAHESRVTMTEIIAPHHCNVRGLCRAGSIMAWVDIAAGIAAKRHATLPSVTRSIDDVAFLHPVKNGDILTIQASVNKSWRTSMEVGVKVEAQTPLTGERFFVAHAYLTFVALSPRPQPKTYLGLKWVEHRPTQVPALCPHSDMEKKRYDMAEQRRQSRFKETNKKQPQQLQSIRDLMREWSQGLREHAHQNTAAIKSHPALHAAAAATTATAAEGEEQPRDKHEDESISSSTGEKSSETLKGDEDEQLSVHHVTTSNKRKRYSMDPIMQLPFTETSMETTFAEVVELVMPQHANTLNITFGGIIIQWLEQCALASAHRLTRGYLLTASIDSLSFITPTHVGDVVTIRSIVSRTYSSSMEVYVSMEAENLQTGETNFTNDAFFTVVAIDKDHIPVRIPRTIPQTEAEMTLFEGGANRRAKRLTQKVELINLVNSASSQGLAAPYISIPMSP